MAQNPTAKKVESFIKEPIENLGYNLWDVRYLKEGVNWYLRVFIDKDTGIDINDCTDVSHLIDPILDEADPIKNPYYLEVCSAGLNRELTRDEHFKKNIGQKVMVKLIRPRENVKEFFGILEKYDGTVTIKTETEKIKFEKNEIVYVKLDDLEDE